MRNYKTEGIRRLISMAASMCDLSPLSPAKRKLNEALLELERLDSERRSKKASPDQVKERRFPDPVSAIRAIDMELKREADKLTRSQDTDLFNE